MVERQGLMLYSQSLQSSPSALVPSKSHLCLSAENPRMPRALRISGSKVRGDVETYRARRKSHDGKRKEWFPAKGSLVSIVCPEQSELKTQHHQGLTAAWSLS